MRRPPWIPTRADLPGLALAFGVGGLALATARALPPSPFVSDVLLAMLFGALVLNTPLRRVLGLALPGPDQDPDRYAPGLRFTGKWVLRLGIVLLGLKVQASFFGSRELGLIGAVSFVTLPTAFFLAHAVGAVAGVRRPLADLLAAGTMICGASAVNAVAPVARAHREEQGVAIATVFLFSVVALLVFRPIAAAIGLDPGLAGLWAGLAVNDLSSAIAVGAQMGGAGGVMAAAAKSARIVMLAPILVALSFLRRDEGPVDVRKSVIDALPGFLLGYLALAVVRVSGDRVFAGVPAWSGTLAADRFAVDLLMSTVAAGIGLNLSVATLLATSARAVMVGGGTSLGMASLGLFLIAAEARGARALAALVGAAALALAFAAYRAATGAGAEARRARARFEAGAQLSLGDARRLLDAVERASTTLDEALLRRVLAQLHPTTAELDPVRASPLPRGEGCRWTTYWEGRSGWALVATCRAPGTCTPIHAHPHRLLGKAVEGELEEIRFAERGPGDVVVVSRAVLGPAQILETDGLATLHAVRVVGDRQAIDLQLRGPEVGEPGRRLRTAAPLDPATLEVGARVAAIEEVDDRPGHGGEGASAGRGGRARRPEGAGA